MSKNFSITKILFLASNPRGMSKLRLNEEARDVKEGLRQAKDREWFAIESQWAIRPRDIRREILYFSPNVVHFSGHGAEDGGLAFENELGQVQLVSPEALSGLFKLFSEHVQCVVLNACYSEIQADAIAQHIGFVVGMGQEIGDQAAIEFSVGFYDALGAGRSVESAYEFGCNAIHMAGIEESLTPVFKKKGELKEREEATLQLKGQNTIMSQSKLPDARLATLTPTQIEYEFVLSGHIDEVDRQKLEAIVLHLREVTGDTTLTYLKVESGSIKLTLKGTEKGFNAIESLIASGQLKQVNGFSIQGVHRAKSDKPNSSSFSIKTDPSHGKQKVTLYLSDELHRQIKIRSSVDGETMSSTTQKAIEFYLKHSEVVDHTSEIETVEVSERDFGEIDVNRNQSVEIEDIISLGANESLETDSGHRYA